LPDESTVLRSAAERIFLANLDWIDRAALTLASRHGLDPDDADDFASTVREKLMDDDYAAIRKHRGDAKLQTYLTTVIANTFKDYCVQRWGRWRPSAIARRAGRIAVRMEALIHRDGHSVAQAMEVLRSEGAIQASSELRRMAMSFPMRTNPRKHEKRLPLDATSPDYADERIVDEERRTVYDRAIESLTEALHKLEPQDQLVLKLRIWEGMAVADIARNLNLEQKPLYRRIERAYKELRKSLETEGIDAQAVRDLIEEP
jgi:RNA polymerase sigma factor for flagellar operon FliA